MRLIWVLGAMLLLTACVAGPDGGRREVARRVLSYPVDAGCHAVPIPDVTVNLVASGPIEDRSLSYRALSKRDTDGQGPSVRRHEVTFGITASKVNGDGSFDGGQKPLPGGQTCLWLTQAKLTLTWDIRIDIAAEIRPGSCPDRVVRQHEAKHVALDQRLQPLLVQAVKNVLIEHGRASTLTSSLAAGQVQVNQALNRMITDTVANFILDRNDQQIAIDTPEEYARVRQLCDQSDWAKLVR